jgi:thiamine biosynthesis lipoprotein
LIAFCWATALSRAAGLDERQLSHHSATRLSMACVYAIDAYGPHAAALPGAVEDAFDEVDRIDRLMSHYKADSPISRLNREAGSHPIVVDAELFDFLAGALQYSRDSDGAFDITVGPLMKAWGFFRGDGRLPPDEELAAARRHVGAWHVRLDARAGTIGFDEPGVELDLGGIAKGYAVDRAVEILRRRHVSAALVSAGGSTIYGFGSPPGREGWDVTLQDPIDPARTALTVNLRDRALSVAGTSEKSFEAGGVTYSHIMDPRTGRPAQGVLTVAVVARRATAGDALDDALFVLGPEGSRAYLTRLPDTEVFFFLPASAGLQSGRSSAGLGESPDARRRADRARGWTMVHRRGGADPGVRRER